MNKKVMKICMVTYKIITSVRFFLLRLDIGNNLLKDGKLLLE